jgi:hypothetical protein
MPFGGLGWGSHDYNPKKRCRDINKSILTRNGRQNDALIIPWPASESAWKSCTLGRMLNHFLTRDLDHESYTHEKRRGKDEQQITKWKEHLQPEKNTA